MAAQGLILRFAVLLAILLVGSAALAQEPGNLERSDTASSIQPEFSLQSVISPFVSAPDRFVNDDFGLTPISFDGDDLNIPGDGSDVPGRVPLPPAPVIAPPRRNEANQRGVQWGGLFKSSLLFLGVMHSFRLATEQGTREPFFNQPFGGYFDALGALHGWSDGDGYYENYLGHPIQGAVSAYIWIHHDTRYRNVEFGKSRDYWMGRMRATAYAWAFSEQFEIGPLSEASIGHIQTKCCAYGFVDHVITPTLGIGWTVLSDIGDRYLVRRIEDHTDSVGLRIFARLALNPAQSFANLLSLEYPWRREDRASPSEYRGELYPEYATSPARSGPDEERPGVPPFQITATVPSVLQFPNLTCYGGGAVAAFRMSPISQWTVEVGGCTLGNSLPTNWSGDSLTFTTGPQWVWNAGGRWNPYFHVRFGGQKITEKFCHNCVQPDPPPPFSPHCPEDPRCAAFNYEATGFSLPVGGGVNVKLNPALSLQVANLEYVRSWLGNLNGENFDNGFRFSTGITLNVGTW